MNFDRQTTLRAPVTLSGIGVHSGAPASICLKPSSPNSGVVFLRKGLDDAPAQLIAAMGGQGLGDIRIAYVDARGTAVSRMELGEIVGREHGYDCRVFGDESRARLWLDYGQP